MPSIAKIDIAFKTPPEETRVKPKNWLLELLKSLFLSPFRACLGTNRKVIQADVKQSYFNDAPIEKEQKKTRELIIQIFTAKPEKGIPWELQLKKRKAAACKAMEAFNKKTAPEYRFCEISFLKIKQLPEISYHEICRDKACLLKRERYS